MALIIVGVMLADGNLLQIVTEKRAYVISLIRNLICPLIMLVVMALLPLDPNLRMAVLIYVACPVANLTSVYAIQHDMEPALLCEGNASVYDFICCNNPIYHLAWTACIWRLNTMLIF